MRDRVELVAEVLEQVAVIGRELSAAREGPFGEISLSKSQLDALFILAHSPAPVTAGGLAKALNVTPGAVTQLVAGLREHGLVEARTPEDGRVRILQLTADARTQVDEFERAAVTRLLPQFAALDVDELTRLTHLLGKRKDTA